MRRLPRIPTTVIALAWALALPEGARASDMGALDRIFHGWYLSQGGLGGKPLVENYEMDETIEYPGTSRPTVKLHMTRTREGQFKIETSQPGIGTFIQAFDGRLGWKAQPQWGMELAPNIQREELPWETNLLIAMDSYEPRIVYSPLGTKDVNGHPCMVTAVTDPRGVVGRCFFDQKDNRLLRLEQRNWHGFQKTLSEEFDDFRVTNGLSIPYVVTVRDGNEFSIHRRTRVVINGPIDLGAFVLTTAQYKEANQVAAVLKKHEESTGGIAALQKIHTRVTHVTVDVPSSGTRISETISQKAPNLILVEIDTPGIGHELRGYDGTTAWFSSELQGYRPLKPREITQLINEGSIHLVERLAETFPYRRLIGDRVAGGRQTTAISLASSQGPAGTFYFDKETGSLLQVGAPVSADRDTSTQATIEFSDFRKIGGVEIPFKVVQTTALVRVVSTVGSVENDVDLDDALFRPRRFD